MADYNAILGHKYRGQWVADMTLEELMNVPPELLDELQLTDD